MYIFSSEGYEFKVNFVTRVLTKWMFFIVSVWPCLTFMLSHSNKDPSEVIHYNIYNSTCRRFDASPTYNLYNNPSIIQIICTHLNIFKELFNFVNLFGWHVEHEA